MKRLLSLSLLTFLFVSLLDANNFQEGKKIFNAKCSTCHAGHIPADKLKENFFEKENKLLNLKSPSVNMLAYTIMDSPKHIGDPDDPEMQQMEVEEYLKDSLYDPKPENSICDASFAKYYDTKKSMKGEVSPEEITALSYYFMAYKKEWMKAHPKKKRILSESYKEKDLLEDAIKENKRIIIEASSSTCHFCKKMKREVLDTEEIQTAMHKDYIFVEVDIDKMKLPFSLQKAFKGITPTFFFLSKEGALLNHYPGSWNSRDWKLLLKENRIKNRSK
jgi:thioredoxin-related protein